MRLALAIAAWICSLYLFCAGAVPLLGLSRSSTNGVMWIAALLVLILFACLLSKRTIRLMQSAPVADGHHWLAKALRFASVLQGRPDARLTLGFFAMLYFFVGRFVLQRSEGAS